MDNWLVIILGLGDMIWSITDKQRTVCCLYPMVIHKPHSSQLEKNASKKSVYVPFDADLSTLFYAKRALELVRLAQLPSMFTSDLVSLDSGCDFFGLFPARMNWSRVLALLLPREGEPAGRPRRWLFNLKNRCPKTLSYAQQRHPWLLSILIHYTFPSISSIFVFHLQPVCELAMCFQMGYWFNWMDSWYLILMSCAKC